MGILQSLLKLLKFKPGFNGTPDMFLALVMEIQAKNNPEYSTSEVLRWGEVMQQVIKVDLAPYKNFAELLQHGKPDLGVVRKVRDKLDELNQRRELKQAIYGPSAELGDDDVMKSDAECPFFARKMIKDLAQHVKFRYEDQGIIDQL